MDVRRAALLLLVPALVVAGCTSAVPGRGTAAPGAAPAGLDQFYDQELRWGACAPYASSSTDQQVFADPDLDCAYLTVPLDYADPGGETARIGVLRTPAADPAARIGSLVINPGGPGVPGMGYAPLIAFGLRGTPLAARFDVVGFDPRGVVSSEPTVDCETDAERDAERAEPVTDGSPEGVATAEAESQEFVARCVERVGEDVLANVGTRDVVRDMDVLRAALGDEQLTYLGYSYGTFIGAKYAEAFPANVRALVLDGAVDPAQSAVEGAVAQSAGFQLAFDAFAADCTARPGCPLGTDPAGAVDAFHALVRPLRAAPVPTALDARPLSYADAMTGVYAALYSDSAWPDLRAGLAELPTGVGTGLMVLADGYEGREPDGVYDNSLEAFPAIGCLDEDRVTDPAVYLEADRRAREVAPFSDDGAGPSSARPPCAFWPVPPTTEPRVPQVEGLPPVLVVSVTGDPATPYEAGVRLADQLGARLLTVQGNQHTVALTGVPCVDDTVTAYLVDGDLPPEGLPCAV